ncbi:hypothetical protein [Microbulbifer sp. TYP-18]|uniref:hypothetical protein n=1 Tax=Microbulbifer sp. TYP-18 TaxID=3230024 RepID=UPI0034C662BC
MTMRLIRYWLFLVIAYLVGLGIYIYYSAIHTFLSSVSASLGFMSPRFLMAAIGVLYLFVFLFGVVFFAFDLRSRDLRERISEVLDAKPYSNCDLVFGRFFALVALSWLPLALFALLLQGLGLVLPLLGSPLGRTLEPVSLLGFVTLVALPAILFCCALVYFISVLVRQQFVALGVSLLLLVGLYTLSVGRAPFPVSSTLDMLGVTQVPLGSDLVPNMLIDGFAWLQRLAVCLLAIGLLFFAAVLHPRINDRSNLGPLIGGGVFAGIAVAMLLVVFFARQGEVEQYLAWQTAHRVASGPAQIEIKQVSADVDISPGEQMTVDYRATIGILADSPVQTLLLSLNPGFALESVAVDDVATEKTSFSQGLLSVNLDSSLPPGGEVELHIRYRGQPDTRFGYLDEILNRYAQSVNSADITLLGKRVGLFDGRFVALTPGLRWLPAAGSEYGRSDTRIRGRDTYSLRMNLSVPKGWDVAGPGYGKQLEQDGRAVYQFVPAIDLSEVAVVTAPFRRFATKIDGIEFALLLHPDHLDNLEFLTTGSSQLREWLSTRLALAKEAGLDYPFRAFTLVEVPNYLRGYGGGWRMDSIMALPAMVLLKETGLPTARFDFDPVATFGGGRAYADAEGGAAIVVRNRLEDFFTNDFTGGNVFTGLAGSFFSHRAGAVGADALALDYALEQLATLVISGQRSYFSAARLVDLNKALEAFMKVPERPGQRLSDRMFSALASDPEILANLRDVPLGEVDPWQSSSLAVEVLALKAGAFAELVYDLLGPRDSGVLLSRLLDRSRQGTFSRADVEAELNDLAPQLADLVGDWFGSSKIARTAITNSSLYQLPDSKNGDLRYQLLIDVGNSAEVAGFFRVAWAMENNGRRNYSEPQKVDAGAELRFGTVLSAPPAQVFIEPYLTQGDEEEGQLQVLLSNQNLQRRDIEPVEGTLQLNRAEDKPVASALPAAQQPVAAPTPDNPT